MQLRYSLLSVFTKRADSGNPLAVVTDTDGLDTEAMQAIARKFGLSETVFVFPPAYQAHTAAIRIFTPTGELPFAGHPTIGAAICLAYQRIWPKMDEECDALAVLEAKGGILRVAVKPAGDDVAFAAFDVPSLPQETAETPPVDRLAAALGLAPTEIGFENFRPRRFSAGSPFTFVPVSGLDAMRRAHVVEEFWDEAFGGDHHPAAYLYCRETVLHKAAFHARAFVPAMGVGGDEDAATGSAAAAFAAIINLFDGPPEGTYNAMIEQGVEMGRPSEIFIEFEVRGRNLRVVRIGGYAVMVGERTAEL
jgi:trans-2,3-dihydro-3-hydroxyanthranilate isomerase